MFRKFIIGAVIIAVASACTATSAQAADEFSPRVSCTSNHYSSDYRTVENQGAVDWDVWRLMHELHYRHCWGSSGVHWADPLSATVGCREIDVDQGSTVRYVRFNARYWDRDGHEKNPSYWQIECTKESWTEKKVFFLEEQRFHKCAGGGPRWDVNVKLNLVLDIDIDTRLAGSFWGFTGPTVINC